MKNKIIFIVMILLVIMVMFSATVNATDTIHTSTSIINDITVNWSYELNESNEIINLKCTNADKVTGNITIPLTLDGYTVISLGNQAFKSATNLTGITIPSGIKTIEAEAFLNCTGLTNVDLGSVEGIGAGAFAGCTALESITIPKTLKNGPSIIDAYVFKNCSNLTTITLEEGLEVVPTRVCAGTNITSIIIPNSVKTIGTEAFLNCTVLTDVDLGSVEGLGAGAFAGCTALESITIPKTLKNGPSIIDAYVFKNCSNLTTITLEEGLEVVPTRVCAGTGITSIIIPNSVKTIEQDAFLDCTELIKIEIYDNVENFYGLDLTSEKVFQNHNDDLTIYCYKGSLAAQYAINHDIKYVYLTKPSTDDNTNTDEDIKDDDTLPDDDTITDTKDETTSKPTETPTTDKEDTTIASGKIPNAGANIVISVAIIFAVFAVIVCCKKYNTYKDIK